MSGRCPGAGEGIAATVAGDESAAGAETAVVFLVGLTTHAPPFRDSDPIMRPGGARSWDELQTYRPSVLKTEDGFEMWYAGMSMSGVEEIGYATSLDGLTWVKDGGNPVFTVSHSWASSASDPAVVLMGDTYRMWFTGWPSAFPFRATIGSATAPVSAVTNVGSDMSGAAPGTFEVSPNYPNPFNPRTKISFELGERSRAKLEIFDVRGRKVRDLFDADFSAGRHYVTWDGAGNTGEGLASGVYFYKLSVGGLSQTRKLTLPR